MRLFNSATLSLLIAATAFSAPHAVSSDGFITVLTKPAGANIWVDNEFAGQSPLENYSQKPGRHEVRAVDPGSGVSVRDTVFVKSDSTSVLDIALTGNFGALSVVTTPPGAEVYLTTRVGLTPVNEDQIVPGAYTLEIRPKAGRYATTTSNIIVVSGNQIALNEKLKRKAAPRNKLIATLGLGAVGIGGFVLGYASLFNAGSVDVDLERPHTASEIDKLNSDRSTSMALSIAGLATGIVCSLGLATVTLYF